MHPYLNATTALLLHEEFLREAERHRRHRGSEPRDRRGWRRPWRGDRGPRRSDHTLAA